MQAINLSNQQQDAVYRAMEWYRNRPGNPEYGDIPMFRLFGYAGSGKTTLARYIVESLGLDHNEVRYAAFTGKAAHVLRSKGCEDASTIHSLIYMPREQARSKLTALKRKREQLAAEPEQDQQQITWLDKVIRAEEKRLESPQFLLRMPQESALTGSKLLVVDEVSMVNDIMAGDLSSFGVPTLVLGDPDQLPPVDGGGSLITATPDSLLTEVHRSALDSPVTRIATTVRMAEPGTRAYGVTGSDGNSGRVRDLSMGALPEYDIVLCGTNAVRWKAIKTIRDIEGCVSNEPYPWPGDRIIILANNGEAGVLNGQIYRVEIAEHDKDSHDLIVTGEDGVTRDLSVWARGFTGPDGERQARLAGTRGSTVAATFGQAITVHKAQGSQWDRVLVIDESHVFSGMTRGGVAEKYRAGQRWLYTAVTRAVSRVTLTGTGVVRR